MMKLTALYCPHTTIKPDRVFADLLLFEKIIHFQVMEDEKPNDWNDLIHSYPPIPFGKDLARFQHLIADLKGHENEFYAGQLSSMALEQMENRDEDTVRGLISAISNEEGEQKDKNNKERERFWQARLLLRLAEIMAEEEEELQHRLTATDHNESLLLEALKGELEEEGLHIPSAISPNTLPVRPEVLLRAWGTLLLADENEKPKILLTDSQDFAEPFFEANEAISGQRPKRLCRLPLPHTLGMDEKNYLATRENFRNQASETLARLTRILAETCQAGESAGTLKEFSQAAALWGSAFGQSGPWGESPRHNKQQCQSHPHLEIYLCNQSLNQLMARLCHPGISLQEEDQSPAIIAVKNTSASTCSG